jgi:hypothetical protein
MTKDYPEIPRPEGIPTNWCSTSGTTANVADALLGERDEVATADIARQGSGTALAHVCR